MRKSIIGWVATALVAPGLALGAVAFAQQQPEQHTEARIGGQRDVEPSPRGQPSEGRQELMTGSFSLALPREQAQQRVNYAIDRTVQQMSWFKRSFAERRLRERNPVREQVETEVSDGTVTVSYGEYEYRSRIGEWTSVTALGEPAELLQEVEGTRIIQTFRTEEGEKETVFDFSENGRYVLLDVTIESSQLPAPLRYSLPYQRTSQYQSDYSAAVPTARTARTT